MAKKTLKIATRKSPLALCQAQIVRELLEGVHPHLKITLLKLKTSGDKLLDSSLSKIGGKGLFVKEIEESLINKKADVAVHSLKDVPCDLPDSLILKIFTPREDPRDAIVFPLHSKKIPNVSEKEILEVLPHGAHIGTSSLRRQTQLLHYRKDLHFLTLRGNVGTRLKKLDTKTSKLDAILLAAAGLKRLGLKDRKVFPLSPEVFIPAVGQGVLGLQIRKDDKATMDLLKKIHDPPTEIFARAERAFLERLKVSCQVPLGGYAYRSHGKLKMKCFISSLDGRKFIQKEMSGDDKFPEELGKKLAEKLLSAGGGKILKELQNEEI